MLGAHQLPAGRRDITLPTSSASSPEAGRFSACEKPAVARASCRQVRRIGDRVVRNQVDVHRQIPAGTRSSAADVVVACRLSRPTAGTRSSPRGLADRGNTAHRLVAARPDQCRWAIGISRSRTAWPGTVQAHGLPHQGQRPARRTMACGNAHGRNQDPLRMQIERPRSVEHAPARCSSLPLCKRLAHAHEHQVANRGVRGQQLVGLHQLVEDFLGRQIPGDSHLGRWRKIASGRAADLRRDAQRRAARGGRKTTVSSSRPCAVRKISLLAPSRAESCRLYSSSG